MRHVPALADRSAPIARRALGTIALLALGAIAILALGAGAPGRDELPVVPAAWRELQAPPRPVRCVDVAAQSDLSSLLRGAAPGAAFCLAPGTYRAPIVIPAGVAVWGPREAVIVSSGHGTTVSLRGSAAALLGVTVDGSGTRYDLEEGAIAAQGEDQRIEGVRVHDALFGIIVSKSERVLLRGNLVEGTRQAQLGMRGDAIRLWETRHSRVENNFVSHSRDVVVWYSSDNVITGNEVRDSRYGTHLMYSHNNVLRGNRYVGDVVGVFLMYSRNVRLERNLLAGSTGAAGMGLGLKESSAVTVRDNAFVKDAVGIFIDNSPFEPGTVDQIERNSLRLCDTAVLLQSGVHDNRFLANRLRGNGTQVAVDGGGDAMANLWRGNDFDDYQGYDFDGDGVGDVPYELRSASGLLLASHAELALLRGSPALFLVDVSSRLLPLYRTKAVLIDERPALTDPLEAPRAD